MPLDGFSSTLCEEVLSPTTLNWGAPWEVPWMWPHLEARYPLGLVSDATTWAWLKV